MKFEEYSKIVKFCFGEELERMGEFLHAIETDETSVDDKPWTANIMGEFMPSKEDVEKVFANHKIVFNQLDFDNEDTIADLRDMILG